jgi:hypothetical protein
MNRRQLLKLPAAAGLAMLLGGHTPYGQWVVYRRKHLLIGCHRADPRTYELAQEVVGVLDDHLPHANSRVARAPDARRIASLLGTDQLETSVLRESEVVAMLHGSGDFVPFGAIALRLLAPVGDRLLVARADFPELHAWLVTGALVGTELAPDPDPVADFGVPWHPGSVASMEGQPAPPVPEGD